MALVLSFSGQPPDGLPPRYVVPPAGASIGRGQANDLVLPDSGQKLSRRHCEIRPDPAGWLLFDLSTNGTFLNDHPARLDPQVPVLLQNGDSVILGDHVLVAQIEPDAPAASLPEDDFPLAPPPADFAAGRFDDFDRLRNDPGGAADPFAAFDLDPHPGAAPPAGPSSDFSLSGEMGGRSRDDLYAVGKVEPAADFSAETAGGDDPFAAFDLDFPGGQGAQSDHADHGAVQFTPPPARREVLPENWMDEEPLAPPSSAATLPPAGMSAPPGARPVAVPGSGRDDDGFAEPPPASGPVVRPVPAAPVAPVAAGEALAHFLAGAGLAPLATGDEAASLRQAGEIFRVLVDGARRLIQARARLKNEFRIEQTMIGSADNNPLKFAVTGEEAAAAMLSPPRPGYLGPVPAAREVFGDLEAHEIAVMVAIQAAMKSVMKRLDPAAIRARAEAEGGGFSLGGGGKKARAWELYEIIFAEVIGSLDEDFDKIFGRAFADAYEDQVRRF